MGNGKVDLINDEVSEWYSNTKGSLGEMIRRFVCDYLSGTLQQNAPSKSCRSKAPRNLFNLSVLSDTLVTH